MPGPLRSLGPIRQSAYVVRDLERAVGWWASLGVGPFLTMRAAPLTGTVMRGRPVEPEITMAFASSGDLQIELVVAHDDTPTVFREALDAGREGPHHLAWWADDWVAWERTAGAARWDPVSYGDGGGFARFAYYEVGGPLLVEVMELNPATRWMVETVRDAHACWDGHTAPVRDLA